MASPTTVNIAPRGDVILVCNDSEDPAKKIRLRTSSVVLQLGSSVFVAMLGPHFKEGSALAENGTVEINLPDDDSQAMTTMCKIMHISPDIMEKVATPQELTLLAQHADKYDTVRALGPATFYWIHENDQKAKKNLVYRANLLGAAMTFRHAGLFEQIGRDCVMQGVMSPGKSQWADCPEHVFGVLCDLAAFRSLILQKAEKFINDQMMVELGEGDENDGSPKATCYCQYQSLRAAALMRQLRSAKLLPISSQKLETTIQAAKSLQFRLAPSTIACPGGEKRCLSLDAVSVDLLAQKFRDEAGTWGNDMRICLKCAQGEGMQYGKKCGHH